MMIPDAFAMRDHYGELKMPVVIIAGDRDRLIDLEDQSARLHGDIPQSTLDRVAGAGHMVHQSAPERVLAAIDKAAAGEGTIAGSLPRNERQHLKGGHVAKGGGRPLHLPHPWRRSRWA